MSIQHFLPAQKDRLLRVLTAREYITTEYKGGKSPFLPERFMTITARIFLLSAVRFLETLLGQVLMVENRSGELIGYSSPNRRLLKKLIQEGRVSKWDSGQRAVDKPAVPYAALTVGAVKNRHGATLMKAGLQGQGTGDTLDEAMTVALAETLERIALCEYNPEQLSLHSVQELIDSKARFAAKPYIYPEMDRKARINWVKGQDLVNGNSVLLPASMAYMSYAAINTLEPVFGPSTSNSSAAYTDIKTATFKAVCEGLERDGFLMYWLNRLAPRRIVLDESADSEVLEKIKLFKKYDIELHFLDCVTEYGIPILVGVLIDNKTGGVDINAAAGFDTDLLLKKVVKDALRWGVGYTRADVSGINQEHMHSLDDRGRLWRGGAMRKEIDFFLQGKEISCADYRQKAESADSTYLLNKVVSRFKARGESLYALDLTNDLAREAGLCVVRVIAPDLVPMYFDEARKPLLVDRLYSFARTMGYANEEIKKENLNKVPHPFI